MSYISKVYLTILLFGVNSYAQNEIRLDSIPKFRGFEWGVSIEDVKSKELAKYLQTFIGFGVYIVSYNGEIAGYNARIDYVFENSVLVESSYCVEVESFPETFSKIKEYFFNILGIPNYWANSHPNSEIDWTIETEDILCRGPELYWEYCDGFIGIIAEKFKDEITISILYAYQKTISEYGKYVIYPYK